MEDVHKAVFALISHQQDFGALLTESSLSVPNVGTNTNEHERQVSTDVSGVYEQCLLNVIKDKARANASTVATTAPVIVGQNLQAVLDNTRELLLNLDQRQKCDVLLNLMKMLFENGDFNISIFILNFVKKVICPLEVVWMMHTKGLVSLDSYIASNLARASVVGKLAQSIAHCCNGEPETRDLRHCIIKDLVGSLLMLAYSDNDTEDNATKGLRKISMALLDSITKRVQQQAACDVSVYQAPAGAGLSPDQLQRFSSRQLALMLSLQPDIKVSQALTQQSSWTFAKMPRFVTESYAQLLLWLPGASVSAPGVSAPAVGLLRRVLEQQEVNWRAVLSYTATVLVLHRDAPDTLQALISELLTSALERCDMEGLIMSVLLVRQACLEGPHVFQTYQTWFSSTFSEGLHNPANSKKSFTFLIKFLTDIVPFEDAAYLKTHVLKPPFAPAKCRPLLSDYILLAKTRLHDLKETVDDVGIYGDAVPAGGGGCQGDSGGGVDQDVERAVADFSRTGRVPASVMEAGIFRKPYFVGKFLPALLKPRPLPDVADAKMRLIESLHSSDKIPASLYQVYDKSCKKISQQLLDGVFTEDDDADMEHLMLSPWEQLIASLGSLAAVVSGHRGDQDGGSGGGGDNVSASLSAQISLLVEKIDGFLGDEAVRDQHPLGQIALDLAQPPTQPKVTQVCEEFLRMLLSCHHECCVRMSGDDWLRPVLASLVRFPDLTRLVFYRIWTLLIEPDGSQGRPLFVPQLSCLAAILRVMVTAPPGLDGIIVGDRAWADALVARLPYTTAPAMRSTFILCLLFLQQSLAVSGEMDCIPARVILLFEFLRVRMTSPAASPGALSASRNEQMLVMETLRTILADDSQYIQHQCQQQQRSRPGPVMSVREWVELELTIVPHHDMLPPTHRQCMMEDVVMSQFVHQSRGHADCTSVCTDIALALLHQQQRSRCGHPTSRTHCCYSADSSGEITILLQRLVHYMPDSDDVWLLQLYSALPPDIDKAHYFNLMLMVPPYLLFTNCVGHLRKEQVEEAVLHVNTHWKNYKTEGAFFSFSTCLYLFKACSLVRQGTMRQLLERCKLARHSVMVHLEALLPHRPTTTADDEGWHILDEMLSLRSLAHNLLPPEGGHVSPPPGIPSELGADAVQLIAAALYSTSQWSSLPLVLKQLLSSEGSEEVVAILAGALLYFLLCSETYNMTVEEVEQMSSATSKIWCELLSLQPNLFPQVMTLGSGFTADKILQIAPVTIIRFLLLAPEDLLASLAGNTESLSCMLQVYSACLNLYDESTEKAPLQPVSLRLLKEGASLVENMMELSSKSGVRDIPMDIISKLDPSVRLLVRKQQNR